MEVILKQDIKNLGFADEIVKVRNGYGLNMDAEALVAKLESVTLSIGAKVGENGKLFGSITSQQLVDKLTAMGYEVDKKQISMPTDHIKKTGAYIAEINVHRDIKAKLNFEVVEG